VGLCAAGAVGATVGDTAVPKYATVFDSGRLKDGFVAVGVRNCGLGVGVCIKRDIGVGAGRASRAVVAAVCVETAAGDTIDDTGPPVAQLRV
jgi:hypothetical protein